MYLALYHTCPSGSSQHGFDIKTSLGFVLLSPNPDLKQLLSANFSFFPNPQRTFELCGGKIKSLLTLLALQRALLIPQKISPVSFSPVL